jgi:hypothetical protein
MWHQEHGGCHSSRSEPQPAAAGVWVLFFWGLRLLQVNTFTAGRHSHLGFFGRWGLVGVEVGSLSVLSIVFMKGLFHGRIGSKTAGTTCLVMC